jgi:hypothetical protein
MIFEKDNPEKMTAKEEKKIMEESMGDPRYDNQQYIEGEGVKSPLEVPEGEHPIDKYLEKKNEEFNHPLAGITDEKLDEMVSSLKKKEDDPVTDWELERLRKKVKKTRDSQVEI